MKAIEISKASRPLSDYAKEIGEEIIVLTSDSKPVAAIISLKGVDAESLSLSANRELMEIIKNAREEFHSGKTLSFDQMKQEVSKME